MDRSRAFSFPLWISWELTRKCNFKCRHCRVDEVPTLGELTDRDISRLLDELESIGIYQINFSGGEPFLHPRFTEILEGCAKRGIIVGLTTNGSLVDDRTCRIIREIDTFRNFQVSLDSSTPVFHDWLRRVPGAWRGAVKAIETAVKNGLKVGIVMTVTRLNVSDVSAVLNLASELGVDVVGARRFFPTGRGADNATDLVVSPETYREHLALLIAHASSHKGRPVVNIEEPLIGAITDAPLMPASGFCPAGNSYGAVTATGAVRACIFLTVDLGNIRERSFKDIWQESSLRHNLTEKRRTSKCGRCPAARVCGGCRAMAYMSTGDPLGDDPSCWRLGDLGEAV